MGLWILLKKWNCAVLAVSSSEKELVLDGFGRCFLLSVLCCLCAGVVRFRWLRSLCLDRARRAFFSTAWRGFTSVFFLLKHITSTPVSSTQPCLHPTPLRVPARSTLDVFDHTPCLCSSVSLWRSHAVSWLFRLSYLSFVAICLWVISALNETSRVHVAGALSARPKDPTL